MANMRKGHEEEKVFSQLIGCLVALGYQVHHLLMDSWCHGSSQHRSRVFVSIAAPGLTPVMKPFMTHNHPSTVNNRSLGKMKNGQPFGVREFYKTPFEHDVAGQATADLPDIGSGTVQACIPFPDHRVVWTMNERDRRLIRCIPLSPPGQGYVQAMNLGLIPETLKKEYKRAPNKAFRRIEETGLFPTITTGVSPQDIRCGNVLHWAQHRIISVMEARRAQGIPDHEVIIGSLAKQWKIIGNGVDRNVALALGLALRQAYEVSHPNYMRHSCPVKEDDYEIIDISSDDEVTPSYKIVDISSDDE